MSEFDVAEEAAAFLRENQKLVTWSAVNGKALIELAEQQDTDRLLEVINGLSARELRMVTLYLSVYTAGMQEIVRAQAASERQGGRVRRGLVHIWKFLAYGK